MKKLIFAILCAVSFSSLLTANVEEPKRSESLFKDFLSNLPEDSYVREKCMQEPCGHCRDVAVAVYLVKTARAENDQAKLHVAYDILYNASLGLFDHDQLSPEQAVTEVESMEQSLNKLSN